MTKGPVEAQLTSEGKAIFGAALPGGWVPLQGLAGGTADLAGIGKQQVQLVDIKALKAEQLEKLLEILTERFKAPKDEIREEITANGLPIRRSMIDYIVLRDPQRWI